MTRQFCGGHAHGDKVILLLAGYDKGEHASAKRQNREIAVGLTQRQLSKKTGIQQSEISRIEAAHGNPTVGTVSVLARALGAEMRLVTAKKRLPKPRLVAQRSASASARVVRRPR